jgi:nucleoside-diphosphate-sugar epimerase
MRVLVTGANGFIGSNIITQLTDTPDITFYAGTRNTIDLYSQENVREYIEDNKIDCIIHCAIEGGRVGIEDTPDIVHKNILMFENLMANSNRIIRFINIASGAEYDRRQSLMRLPWTMDNPPIKSVPVDYYGLSKYVISERMRDRGESNYINLRLFGCFGNYESDDRMIRKSIKNYINGDPIIIHRDRYMDFFYVNDFVQIVKFYLTIDDHFYKGNPSVFWKDMDISYYRKDKLSDIANIINNLDKKKVPVIIENPENGNSYCGYSPLYAFPVEFIGLENGIKECYERIKKDNVLH